jgi:hypothetical protein
MNRRIISPTGIPVKLTRITAFTLLSVSARFSLREAWFAKRWVRAEGFTEVWNCPLAVKELIEEVIRTRHGVTDYD